MKHTFQSLIAAATIATILGAAGVASAANTSAEAKCHAAIAKNVAKYQAGLIKAQAGCHKSRNAAKLDNPAAVNCNTAAGADLKGKRSSNRSKAVGGITKACQLDVPADTAAVLALYPRCPSPVKTSDDAGTSGIDSFTELGNCLLDLSEAYVDRVGAEVLGSPSAAAIGTEGLPKGLQSCVNGMGKALSSLAKASATLNKCQAGVEKALTGLDLTATCLNDSDVTSAINEAQANFDAVVADACGAENMVNGAADFRTIGTCGESVSQVQTCAGDRTAFPTIRGLVAAAQEFPNDGMGNLTCSAGGADVIINAGRGIKQTDTRLDTGYSGFAHGVDVIDQYKGRVFITGCNADCENCSITMDTTAGNCRCETTIPPLPIPANAATVECTTIGGPDPACGGGICQCMFGPPLPLSASGTPTCVVNRFADDFSGTTGAIGEYDVLTSTRALVMTGGTQTRPCPTCNGDANPRSGDNAGGTCSGGPRNSLPCDEDARHSVFGPTSFDCPPNPGSNVAGAGLGLALQFSSSTKTINAAIANPLYCASGTCHCSVCSGDSAVGCTVNADCAAFGAGTCGTNLGGQNPSANTCTTSCTADPANPGMGICDGPDDNFCSGVTKANGGGIITCSVDADCTALDASCPGGSCGTCSLATTRSCFLPTVSATGTPGIFNSEGVSAFCSGLTGNPGVNSAGGLPGPGRITLDFDFNLWCNGSTTNRFQLPMGSNCNP